jgi:hypothetical protein
VIHYLQFTKTWLALGFVVLGLFEFWTAMRVFGSKGKPGKHNRLLLRLHRIGGYLFLVYGIALSWLGLSMLETYHAGGHYDFGPREYSHAFLAVCLLVLLLLKIAFIRFYRRYRPYVPLLGIIVAAMAVVIWVVAGLMFWFKMGGSQVVGEQAAAALSLLF